MNDALKTVIPVKNKVKAKEKKRIMARRNIGKPGQPPIYRAAERLLQWATPVIDSLPKSLATQTMGGAVIRNLLDALLLIQMAM